MRKKNTLFIVLLGLVFISLKVFAKENQVQIQSLENYSRITIPVNNSSNFKTKTITKDGLEIALQLEHISQGVFSNAANISDQRVKALKIVQQAFDKTELRLFLAQNSMEYFAYLQPSPPALIVDIWEKKSKQAQMTPAKRKIERKIASVKTKVISEPHKDILPDIVPINDNTAIFQRFPLPMPPFTYEGKNFRIPYNNNLETYWKWSKVDKSTAPGEKFSFAQKLFKEKKYGLCIRAIELTERDHPKNPYADEMLFLKAVSYKRLGDQTKQDALVLKAEEIYLKLMNKIDDKGRSMPFASQLKFYFATKAYDNKRWIDAIEQFEALGKILNEKVEDFLALHMVLADNYITIDQPRKAERIYRFITEKYPDNDLAKEALYRRGAMLSLEKNYERAAEVMEEALKQYPGYKEKRTEIHFNLGEAYFGLRNYKKASEHFTVFIKKHPSQTLSAQAYLRLGEIAEIQNKNIVEARKHYLEAKNHYPYSLGAKIAALRLARLSINEEKDLLFPIRQIQEILSDVSFPLEAKKIARAVLIEYLMKLGENKNAAVNALSAMSEVSGEVEYARFRDLYVKALVSELGAYTEKKNYSKALALYEEQKRWITLGGAIVFKHLADIHRGLGIFAMSNKYMQMYITAKKEEGGRSIASSGDEKNLQLIRAKNSFTQGKFAEALNYASKLEESADVLRIQAGSNFKLSRVKEAHSQAEKAFMAYAKNKENVDDKKFEEIIIDLTEILLDRSTKDKNYAETENIVKRSKDILKKNERYEFLYADALWYQKKHEQAAKQYKKLIEAFPKSERVARSKYNLAMSELALGKRSDAVKTLTELRDSSQNVWGQSAKQELELLEWEKKYSSVLRSLPPSGLGISN